MEIVKKQTPSLADSCYCLFPFWSLGVNEEFWVLELSLLLTPAWIEESESNCLVKLAASMCPYPCYGQIVLIQFDIVEHS